MKLFFRRIYPWAAISFIASFSLNQAQATSVGVCPDNPDVAFNNSDAVVLAKVVGNKDDTTSTIVEIDVQKYWKRDGRLPKYVYVSTPGLELNSMYVLFLKSANLKPTADNPELIYHLETCSPLARIAGRSKDSINSILYLNKKEPHNVY